MVNINDDNQHDDTNEGDACKDDTIGERRLNTMKVMDDAFASAVANEKRLSKSDKLWFSFWRVYSGRGIGEIEDRAGKFRGDAGTVWEIISVLWAVLRARTGKLGLGKGRFRVEDLGMLCLMQRFADAAGDSVFYTDCIVAFGGMGLTRGKVFETIKRFQRIGLVERMPSVMVKGGRKMVLYRLSEGGKELIRDIVLDIERAHARISWLVRDDPEYSVVFRSMVERFCLGIDDEVTMPGAPDATLYDIDIKELRKKR
jgi:hypothetical protein